MAEGLRSKGNNDYFTDLFAKFEKTVREQLSGMQEQLDYVKTELLTSNSRLTNLESAREGSVSVMPSSSTLPPSHHQNSDRHNDCRSGLIPKFKLEVPRFNGTDPEGWSFKINQSFQFHQTPEEHRITIASFQMDGPALGWFQWMQNNNQISSWQNLLQIFNFLIWPFSVR